jgi:hypothetical protein
MWTGPSPLLGGKQKILLDIGKKLAKFHGKVDRELADFCDSNHLHLNGGFHVQL